MKHWLRRTMVAASTLVLFLCGCGNTHPDNVTHQVTESFSCEASIHYREMETQARLTCTDEGKLTMTFSLPKSLSGVTLGWDGADMTMELGGMSLALPAEKVPESALIHRLTQVLTASHPAGNETEEGYVIAGEADGVAYALVCDAATGLPLSLSVPEEELEATFTDVQKIVTQSGHS